MIPSVEISCDRKARGMLTQKKMKTLAGTDEMMFASVSCDGNDSGTFTQKKMKTLAGTELILASVSCDGVASGTFTQYENEDVEAEYGGVWTVGVHIIEDIDPKCSISGKRARKPASVERGRVLERGDSCAQPSLKTLKKVYDQNSDENSREGFSVMASAGHSWGVPEQRSWTMS